MIRVAQDTSIFESVSFEETKSESKFGFFFLFDLFRLRHLEREKKKQKSLSMDPTVKIYLVSSSKENNFRDRKIRICIRINSETQEQQPFRVIYRIRKRYVYVTQVTCYGQQKCFRFHSLNQLSRRSISIQISAKKHWLPIVEWGNILVHPSNWSTYLRDIFIWITLTNMSLCIFVVHICSHITKRPLIW